MADKKKISFCITCKGRLEHLKQTLPENLKNTHNYPNVEFVVLDYDSRDGLADWIRQNYQAEIESGRIRYAKFAPAPYFRMSHAKNMAHRVATGEILCNLDADNIIPPGFANKLNKEFSENPDIFVRTNYYYMFIKRLLGTPQRGAGGKIALLRDRFMQLHGYDERYKGWGDEDDNISDRAHYSGLKRVLIPVYMQGEVLQHSDAERTENFPAEVKAHSDKLLEHKRTLGGRIDRLAKMNTTSSDHPPQANPDGNFGCGKVRINFKEDIVLEPVAPDHNAADLKNGTVAVKPLVTRTNGRAH